ncbi:MAG TPA: TonB-dependent receptor plug domain-containing protein [Gemmatimonadales bacterium]|nr:TonB-dependent receptor plug domain-containing protein [Gemmatimonadales bacterium]
MKQVALVACVWLALVACSTRRQPSSVLTGPSGGRLITADMIEASGATTAWDALRRTVPNISFRETSRGTPARVVRRGRSSIYLNDQPRVVLDGATLSDFQVLDQIPARDVFSIEVLSGIHGTTYYGTGAANGVILIRTRTAP